MIVSAASRMVSAISFGVFCRAAPSTSAIIRSTNDSPGLRRDLHDDPVGQHGRAAGDRRCGRRPTRGSTGADSPVMADSSTVAMPSTTSPSPGIDLARLDDHEVADPQLGAGHLAPRRRRRAAGARRSPSWCARSDSACALPRPSATASARLANSTVNHSHTAISQANTLGSAIAKTGDQHRARPRRRT